MYVCEDSLPHILAASAMYELKWQSVETPAAVLRESSTKVVMELIRSRMEVVLKPLQSCSKDVTKRPFYTDSIALDKHPPCATMVSAASFCRMLFDNSINFQCHGGKEPP